MSKADQPTTVREDDVAVHSRRIRIPQHLASEGDIVQVTLHADGDEKHFSAEVKSGRRITIPSRFREEYGIEDGDHINIEVTTV